MKTKQLKWWIFIALLSVNQLITAQTCDVNGGTISPSGNTSICSGDGNDDIVNVNLTNNTGDNSVWVLTDQENVILETGTSASFNFEGFDGGVIIIYHISHDGSVTISPEVDLDDLTGCFDLSNPISIFLDFISGGVIYDDNNTTTRTICVGDGIDDNIIMTLEENQGAANAWVVTDEAGVILDLPIAPIFSFEGVDPGICFIYNLSFNNINGLVIGNNIENLTGCYDFSNPYRVMRSGGEVIGGTISTASSTQFCSGDGNENLIEIDLLGNVGDNSLFLLTDNSGRIVFTQESPNINLEGFTEESLNLWHLSYQDGINNLMIGNRFSDLEGCFNFSNSIDISLEVVEAGTINNINGSNDLIFCSDDGIADLVAIQVLESSGNVNRFVIVDEEGEIIDLTFNNAFNFEGVEVGFNRIYNISYNEIPQGLALGQNISILNGCYDLSNPINITRIAGNVSTVSISTTDDTNICTGDGIEDFIDVQVTGEASGIGAWIITDEDSTILELPSAPPFNFSNAPSGLCRIFFIDYVEGTTGLEVSKNLSNIEGCYAISNDIEVQRSGVNGGNLTLTNGDTTLLICVKNSGSNFLPLELEGAIGSNSRWIVTIDNDSIILVSGNNNIDFNITEPGQCKLWHISFESGITGLSLRGLLENLEGCYSLSNPIIINKQEGNTFPGSIFTNDPTDVCIGEGSGENIFFEELPGVGSISNWIITDEGGKIIQVQLSRSVFVDDLPGGVCLVRNIRYEEGILGLEPGELITDLQGCFSLSNSVSISKTEVNGGSISIRESGLNQQVICNGSGMSTLVQLDVNGFKGDESRFLITTLGGNIIDITNSSSFDFADSDQGEYILWHIGYVDGISGLEIGNNINEISGCFDISNAVNISLQEVNGGIIQSIDGESSIDLCVGEGITDLVELLLVNVVGTQRRWILTNNTGEIIRFPNGPVYNFEQEPSGTSFIYNISYIGNIVNLEIGRNINDIEGCFDLSNAFRVSKSSVKSGQLRIKDNQSTTIELCATDAIADVVSFEVNNNEGPVLQLYRTNSEGRILEIYNTMEIDFSNSEHGSTLIGSITYYTISGFEIGNNITDLEGCFNISNTVTIITNRPDGGLLRNDEALTFSEICTGEGVTDFINIRLSGIEGSNSRWFITDENGIIQQNNRTPPFNFENSGSGTSRIFHVAYEGELSGTAIGLNINTLQGCYDLSNALTVIRKNVNEGTISTLDDQIEKTICIGDDYFFDIELKVEGNEGESETWLVTDTLGTILAFQDESVFNFDNAGIGSCLVYHVAFNDELMNLEVGNKVDTLEGCHLVSNSVRINRVEGEACTTSTIEHNGDEYSLNIFPNPATDEIYIHSDLPTHQIDNILIYNINGKMVKRVSPSLLNVPVRITDFQPGVYLLGVNVRNKVHTFKFIKK